MKKLILVSCCIVLLSSGCLLSNGRVCPVKQQLTDMQQTLTDRLRDPQALPNNIWSSLRQGLQLQCEQNRPRMQKQLAWLSNNPNYLSRVAEPASSYIFYVNQRIIEEELPAELALLPIVESTYDPFAQSQAGALGLWQLISATAHRFGATHNWWYDSRRDIKASTDIALTYLNFLYEYFDNDWLLALAAYNSGEGTVNRAQAYNVAHHKSTDFWSLSTLPKQTKNYVPRVLALACVIRSPQKFHITLPELDTPQPLIAVNIKSQIDLSHVAKLVKLPVKEIYRLNPGFNRWATSPTGPHTLLLPAQQAELLKIKLQHLPEKKRQVWRRYRIHKGDTLHSIAHAHHVKVSFLKQINRLHRNMIRSGHYLLVPTSTRQIV